ncbi:unnamed protein product [Cuscuta epithymum]|uniref:Uncharacterized protein n=1 Tax=Cuscuta epithymum TaxID=186058 RepID=A0AAV0F675_9ASTE|nr:unnamed protein product [Cuscuta epithymum]
MADIVNSYKKMSMEEQENELNFNEEVEECGEEELEPKSFPVVGVVVTDRKVKLPVFQELMSSIWRPGRGMSIKEIGERRWLFLSLGHGRMVTCGSFLLLYPC